ncbi:MAG: methyltransferase [Phycisphaerae bacterium]
MDTNINPSHIMQVGSGFWASKVLLTAVEFGVFTLLGKGPMTGKELESALELHPRGTWDFLDALVALKFLDRDGDGEEAKYRNTAETATFLDENSPAYIGGILKMFNARLFGFWNGLGTALRTGEPQNETKGGGPSIFEELYRDQGKLEEFVDAMSGISAGNFMALAKKFDFSKYETLCDVGGSSGLLSILVATEHPNLKCTTLDLPPIAPIAQKHIDAAGLSDRITTASGDFFKDPLPKADVLTMGMILHDWDLDNKKHLIRAAYDALTDGGALIVVENVIDDARRENVFGLLMSLNMLIEFGVAFDFTGADYARWCKEAGFKKIEIVPLAGPASAGVAFK